MKFGNLKFHEITDTKTQSAVKLECDWQIQITFDITEGCYDCNLYDAKGSIADSEEGLDKEGVEQFILKSKELVEDFKGCMAECYVS